MQLVFVCTNKTPLEGESLVLNNLKSKNPNLSFSSVFNTDFEQYGKVLPEYNFEPLQKIMLQREVPAEGNIYVGKDEEMTQGPLANILSAGFYGGMPVQIGYCNGNSSTLNAFEYHKGSEINIAATDFVLLLGQVQDIQGNKINSSNAKAFYVPAGTAIELYATTLHFSPCKTTKYGYKCVVILPYGTNNVLPTLPKPITSEDNLLWMQNKWLIAHKDSAPASKGAHVGLLGKNIEVLF